MINCANNPVEVEGDYYHTNYYLDYNIAVIYLHTPISYDLSLYLSLLLGGIDIIDTS